MSEKRQSFLSAVWSDVVILNYEADPNLLIHRVPKGTTLDSFGGKTYVSLVGFRFRKTKLFSSLAVPLHSDFDEVNLRFYVRRKAGDETRRGVVFIAEVVARRAIAAVARLFYDENYQCFPMKHWLGVENSKRTYQYEWKIGDQWCKLAAETSGNPEIPSEGSLEQFIAEHYWGYSAQKNGRSFEYHVSHPSWRVWSSTTATFEGDATRVYGAALASLIQRRPDSAFVADGSAVTVFQRVEI